MTYDDVCISIAYAITRFEDQSGQQPSVVFMSKDYFEKACKTIPQYLTYAQFNHSIATFWGLPIMVVDYPGDKLRVGIEFPVKEDV